MKRVDLDNFAQYDCVLIVTGHDYDYARIARESQLVVDTRKATRGLQSPNIARCLPLVLYIRAEVFLWRQYPHVFLSNSSRSSGSSVSFSPQTALVYV
jgi:hypothetical protein